MKTISLPIAQSLTRSQRYRLRQNGIFVPAIPARIGYKQTVEHVEKRKKTGAKHYAWQGNAISEKGGRKRALRLFPNIGPCEQCNAPNAERHHVDGNTANNERSNIKALCRRCHMSKDGRLEVFRVLAVSRIDITIASAAAKKTARVDCKRGHPLHGENVFITSQGSRGCKECRKIYKATYLEKQK